MHVLVTGSAGFIGSHTCERLLRDGHTVTGLDTLTDFYDPAIKRQNLAEIQALGLPFAHKHVDLLDEPALLAALSGVDVVIHLAAMAGVQPSIRQPTRYEAVNVRGTLNLLQAMQTAGVGRLVFASSSSVYGNSPTVPFDEADVVDHPISPYAASKKAGELFAYTWHHLHGLSVACLRFFTVYGPRQRPDLAISKFIQRIADGQTIELYGDGSTARDYTYVSDTVDGIVRALAWTQTPGYRVFNLGNSEPVTLRDLVAHIEVAVGRQAQIAWQPMQPGDVDRTWANVARARVELGYSPQVAITAGIASQAAWFMAGRQRNG